MVSKLIALQQPLRTVIKDTPEVVHYLRTKIADKPMIEGGEPSSNKKPSSKPPMNLNLMSAADDAFAALAYWCEWFGIRVPGRTYRVGGRVAGLVDGHEWVVQRFADELLAQLDRSSVEPDGIYDMEPVGLWWTRQRTFRAFPELRRRYLFDPLEEKIVEAAVASYEEEGLFDVG